jgi:hypothetical protein
MNTKPLITLWTEWLSESEKLITLLHEQTVGVTMRDVGRVELLQPQLEIQTARVRDVDERALAEAHRLAESLGCAPNVRSLVSVLDKNEAATVQMTVNKVLTNVQRVQELTEKNRKLIESEMTYINGTLTLIAKAAAPTKGPYRSRQGSSKSILVDAAA